VRRRAGAGHGLGPRDARRRGHSEPAPGVVDEQPLAVGAKAQCRVGAEHGDAADALPDVHEGGAEAAALGRLRQLRERGARGGETGGDTRREPTGRRDGRDRARARHDDPDRNHHPHASQYARAA